MKTRISGNPIITVRKNEAFIDGISTRNIVEQFGTPVFVFSENKIRENCSHFLQKFQQYFPNLLVLYSYKANYLPQICEIINLEGIGAETVTIFELELAIKLKIAPEKIHLGGVYLPNETVELASENNIGLISICSFTQLSNISELLKKRDKSQAIGLQIMSPKFESRIGFAPTKDNFNKFAEILSKNPNLKLEALNSHYGTQIMKSSIYKKNAEYLLNAATLIEQIGLNFEQINLGGGFPEASVIKDMQLEAIGENIKLLLTEHGWQNKKIVFEPGRYIIGDAGILLTAVIDINYENQKWIYVNAGTNVCPVWADSNIRFYCANKINQRNKVPVNIAGPLPTSMDILSKHVPFIENIEINDNIMILNAGAYFLTWGTHFPFPQPPCVLIKNNQLIQIRPQKDPSFFL